MADTYVLRVFVTIILTTENINRTKNYNVLNSRIILKSTEKKPLYNLIVLILRLNIHSKQLEHDS